MNRGTRIFQKDGTRLSKNLEGVENGINDMDLVDLMEMICDWKAASKRHNDGNILKSLELNKDRFHIDAQLYSILKNTVDRYMKE